MAMRPPPPPVRPDPPRPARASAPVAAYGAGGERWLAVRVAAVCAAGFALGLLLGALVPY